MNFCYTNEQEALRVRVRAFIVEHVTDAVLAENDSGDLITEHGPETVRLFGEMQRAGWLALSWPKEWGGQGASRIDQYIVEEEFARASIYLAGGGTGAPAILAAGSDEQKEYFLRASIRGDISFAQGFTEPDAGADLASLRCRAERDGDHYVINGQKMFTTTAHISTHIYLLARTDPEAERHSGLSIFLIPMDTPGVTVRPLWTIQNDPAAPRGTTYGESRTNEVFLDDVIVPEAWRLGPENEGWAISQRGLNLDRVGAARFLMSVRRDEDIVNWLKSDDVGSSEMRSDPVIRDRVAELWIEAQLCRLMTMRSMSMEEAGASFTYEGAAEKVWAPEHGTRSTEAIAQMLGARSQLVSDSPDAVLGGLFAHNLLGAFQSTINHGSVQVMRDQVARYGVGLPKSR